MMCPKCGARFRVKDSRPGTTEATIHWVQDALAWARTSVGWYTPTDFVVRRRLCETCGHTQRSIEILEEDLPHLLVTPPDTPPEEAP